MGKIAFLFSGQGAQYSGMGRELCETCPESAAIFEAADRIRPGTSSQCFSGSEEELSKTVNTQPCMFAVEVAAAAALSAAGVKPDSVAGFSVGEISALAFSGAVSFRDGFELVCSRSRFMQEDTAKAESEMAAVLKLDAETLEKLCLQHEQVYPVNYNCPGQISVAGLKQNMPAFYQSVKAAGGRAIPLRVSGGFHSPFMADASEKFGEVLKSVPIGAPKVKLYSNFTGLPYEGDYVRLLSKQICNPVRWQGIVERMIEDGVDTFIELGPGKTLCGFVGKIDPGVRTFHVEDGKSLQETLSGVKEC